MLIDTADQQWCIAKAHGGITCMGNSFANATAIAALPEVLQALADVLQRIGESEHWWMDSPSKGGFDVEAIRAALLKAGCQIND